MRRLRPLGSILCATVLALAGAAPAIAQTPVTDQYLPAATQKTPPKVAAATGAATSQGKSGSAPGGSAGTGGGTGAAAAQGAAGGDRGGGYSGVAPVPVQAAQGTKLPFTGGTVPLVAMLGLALLATGLVGYAVSRRRSAARSS